MYSRFSVLNAKITQTMNKIQLAPIGADPIADFLKSLPNVPLLNASGYYSQGKEVIVLEYILNGCTVKTSITKGGIS
jgi:hypothetical protein